ncbi:MAG: hypothetical protein WC565_09050 [Parcubacteria group bacterium]|jgi:co-chaperonin GroES (HSP10)|nr:hypothetical protein [Candidatus Krumholzibacteria bacterium]
MVKPITLDNVVEVHPEPLWDNVLLVQWDDESRSGLVLPETAKENVFVFFKVVAVGSDVDACIAPGDKVATGLSSGGRIHGFEYGKRKYVLANQRSVVAIIPKG